MIVLGGQKLEKKAKVMVGPVSKGLPSYQSSVRVVKEYVTEALGRHSPPSSLLSP